MDELIGFGAILLMAFLVLKAILAGVIAVVLSIVYALVWVFLKMSVVAGHPSGVVLACGFIGAAIGIRLHNRHLGKRVVTSTEDCAEIYGVRLTPEGWARVVSLGGLSLVLIYGLLWQP